MYSNPVNLMEADSECIKKFVDSFDYVLSDCDGVIWTKTPLPGAAEFFELMVQHGKKVHFVSNNSLRSKEQYDALFKSVGISNGSDNLTVPSTAIAQYLKSVNFDKKVYCVACPETIRVLTYEGFECKQGPDLGSDAVYEYVNYLEDDKEIGAVVFDSDFKVNLPKIYKALTFARRPEVLLIDGARDKYVPFKIGCLGLGTAIFTDVVAQETQREPIQMAKPSKLFGEFAMKRAGVTNPSRVLFIGDMIDQDVALGNAMGFKTLLVLTTTTKENMMKNTTLIPDFFANSLESLVPLLLKLKNQL